MQEHLQNNNQTNQPSYAVYSFQHQESEKKGQNWRNHGLCSSKDEAFWIAEQLTRCEDVERVEIRLQKQNARTNSFKERRIKLIDKNGEKTNILTRIKNLFN